METITVQTLAEFTKLIEETCLDQSDILFRGQADDWPLLPAIARERLTDDALLVERLMLDEFQRHSVPFLRVPPSTLWDWVALVQHHGLPTRLLDWSLNPLTSLWFAVQRAAHAKSKGVVWIFRPDKEDFATESDKNTLKCKRHMVFAPRHITERITAQIAWFTVHKSWSGNPEFEPLEQYDGFQSKLTKIIIPGNRFAHFRFHLDRCGVNYGSIFPGMDGLCAHIKWKYCYLEDEGERPVKL
jgi:hypothetical protein